MREEQLDIVSQLLRFVNAVDKLKKPDVNILPDQLIQENKKNIIILKKRLDTADLESSSEDDNDKVQESSNDSVDEDECYDDLGVDDDVVGSENIIMVSSPDEWAKLTFKQRLQQLVVYKKKYGHCKVPQLYKENPSMGLWVRDLRVKKRKGKLPSEVEERLDKIGFVWNCRKRKKTKKPSKRLPWEDRFNQLKAYYEKHGHCRIPSTHKNKQLFHWVTNQRRDYRCGVMTVSRIKKLESVGFEWNTQRNSKKSKTVDVEKVEV